MNGKVVENSEDQNITQGAHSQQRTWCFKTLWSINREEVTPGRIPSATNPRFMTKQTCGLWGSLDVVWWDLTQKAAWKSRNFKEKRTYSTLPWASVFSEGGNKFLACIMLLYLVLVEEKYKPNKITATHRLNQRHLAFQPTSPALNLPFPPRCLPGLWNSDMPTIPSFLSYNWKT